jgi:hypothetical protein
MRSAEMYLIEAEAYAGNNAAAGKWFLANRDVSMFSLLILDNL